MRGGNKERHSVFLKKACCSLPLTSGTIIEVVLFAVDVTVGNVVRVGGSSDHSSRKEESRRELSSS